jgi:cytochrome c biogenesis protein CcmG/thiol:disulfide interchange protein DsbE
MTRRRTALFGASAIGVVMLAFVIVLATRKSAIDQQARSPLLDKVAPALAGTDLSGKPFDLASFRGKYVLVNFFASWCVPCQQEQPQLVRFANDPAHDRTVVGVLFEDTSGPASSFLSGNGGTWPALADDSGQHALDWGVRGPPESYLVDPSGIVLAKFVGEVSAARLDQLVSEAQHAA